MSSKPCGWRSRWRIPDHRDPLPNTASYLNGAEVRHHKPAPRITRRIQGVDSGILWMVRNIVMQCKTFRVFIALQATSDQSVTRTLCYDAKNPLGMSSATEARESLTDKPHSRFKGGFRRQGENLRAKPASRIVPVTQTTTPPEPWFYWLPA
jgi:hypothetical protein